MNKKTLIYWMAANPVAANMTMSIIIIAGLLMCFRVKQEVFPEITPDIVNVRVAYPGASPEEVQKGIILAIEEAVTGIEGIKELNASAREGGGSVTIELLEGTDLQKTAQDIREEIQRVRTFPADIERPTTSLIQRKQQVMTFIVYGSENKKELREYAELFKEKLLAANEITQVNLTNVKPFEISIEIPKNKLDAYRLTLAEVARIIRANALELPGGGLKTKDGEILVRVDERRYKGYEFANIVIKKSQGHDVTLKDIATIKDQFENIDRGSWYNNKPAIQVDVYRVGSQTPLEISKISKTISDKFRQILPGNIDIDLWSDRSEAYRSRMNLLMRNGLAGLVLVLILLGLFLELRLAFWVTMGIPISFLGALMLLPAFDVTINMVSMFAFLLALGIVVDDAVVVGENIYDHQNEGGDYLEAAVKGVNEVALPVVFSVLTNIIAFVPLLFVPGTTGKIFKNIPSVVILVFAVSLFESLLILPHHLKKKVEPGFFGKMSRRVQLSVNNILQNFTKNIYTPLLEIALKFRYTTFAIGIGILLLTAAFLASGKIGMTNFPKVDSDHAVAELTLPFGSDINMTKEIEQKLIKIAKKIIKDNGGKNLASNIMTNFSASHACKINIRMAPPEIRKMSTKDFSILWREKAGTILGVETLKFNSESGGPHSRPPIAIELNHKDMTVLKAASKDLAEKLKTFAQVKDLDDGFLEGKVQFTFKLNEIGESFGLTPNEIASQLRHSFYGAESFRQQRGKHEMKIMVRLPENERTNLADITKLRIKLPTGREMPVNEVATIIKGRSYTEIKRHNGKQQITVIADVNPRSQAGLILKELRSPQKNLTTGKIRPAFLTQLKHKYPGLTTSNQGGSKDIRKALETLKIGFSIAMLIIFSLLAVTFKSYLQPMIILAAIPFGLIGAIIGHIVMGYSLSIISMMGLVALSGVVINDSLVLIEYTNRLYREGFSSQQAILQSAKRRLRPIILTTLTTFGGLLPMIFETSRQARFLIPMAISLGFGIMFATFITLILVPAFYLIVDDIRNLLGTNEKLTTK